MHAQTEGPALATRDVRVEEFGGPCRGRPYGPLVKSPAEDQPQATRQDERRPGGFFARYRMASLSELLIRPSNSA